jgi:hypothetical protein
MKDCILAIFWPKKKIYEFFKDCSVPAPVLKSIERWDAKGLSRAAMIDQVFADLGNRPDNGTLQFELMLEQLATWSHFDDYWFVTEQKLDLDTAKQKIAAVRIAKFDHIDVARKAADEKRAKDVARQERYQSLEAMQEDFFMVATKSATPQARGYAFERFLVKMARFFDLQVTNSFRIEGTQIDGSIKYDGENYNIEAKWEHQLMSDEPLLAFCQKLQINMHGRGIFISINGFSLGALSILERSGVKNTVLIDGEDITLILYEMVTLPDALDKKIHAAQTRGQFYIHPVTGESKITRIG